MRDDGPTCFAHADSPSQHMEIDEQMFLMWRKSTHRCTAGRFMIGIRSAACASSTEYLPVRDMTRTGPGPTTPVRSRSGFTGQSTLSRHRLEYGERDEFEWISQVNSSPFHGVGPDTRQRVPGSLLP